MLRLRHSALRQCLSLQLRQQIRWSSSLVEALQREIDEEEANAGEIPERLGELLASSTFQVSDAASSQSPFHVHLATDSGTTAAFDVRSLVPEDEEDETPRELPLTIAFAGASGGLRVSALCSQEPDEGALLSIDTVEVLADSTTVDEVLACEEEDYSPEFSELDEGVQSEWAAFLATHGVDDDLASLALEVADLQEQSHYRDWLQRAQSFVVEAK